MNDLKISQFVPLWDNVIVYPIKRNEKDGFVRPQGDEDKSEVGEVVASAVPDFAPGDIVLFNKYSTTNQDLGKELIVRAEDIVAIKKK